MFPRHHMSQHSEKPPKPGLGLTGKPPPNQSGPWSPCSVCQIKGCPKGKFADAQCDVHGNPSKSHLAVISDEKFAAYRGKIDEARSKAGKSVLIYPTWGAPPSSSSHQAPAQDEQEADRQQMQHQLAAELAQYEEAMQDSDIFPSA